MLTVLVAAALISLGQILVAVVPDSASPTNQKADTEFQELGDEGLLQLPTDFADLVRRNQAAVVVEILDFGSVTLRDATTRSGTRIGTQGWASYHVQIKDVLFNKLAGNAPPLTANTELRLTQRVGRDEAKAFVARSRVQQNDECLLFLWHRSGSDEWSIVAWPLQFRRSRTVSGMAEPVLPVRQMTWLDQSGLPVRRDHNQILLDWPSLIREVRRLGTLSQ
jgi:hypothetical protein